MVLAFRWLNGRTSARPGKMIAPVYEQLSRDFPDVRFYKVDIDKDQISRSVAASDVSAVVRFHRGVPPGYYLPASRIHRT
jgi:hypothetical protein